MAIKKIKVGNTTYDIQDANAYVKPSGGIPKTDLASAVQTSLGKADSAYQKPSSGIPKTDLASDIVNDYLTKFASQSAYDSAKSSLVKPNVSLVGTKVVYTPIDWGDYLHADGRVDKTASSDVIGICIIPSSHYGKARFMSVKKMSTSSTSGTTSSEGIKFWNNQETLPIPETTKFVGMALQADSTYPAMNDYDNERYAYMPTDRLHSGYEDDGYIEKVVGDTIAKYWYNDDDENDRYVPSPFRADGSLNPDYCKAWPNCLSDIDGEKNTAICLATNANNYPAAKACNDFAPGFGKWYLPAVGELAYIVPRWGAIRDKLTALSNAGCLVAMLGADDYFWSSSAYSPDSSWFVGMYDGGVSYGDRGSSGYVLAVSAL